MLEDIKKDIVKLIAMYEAEKEENISLRKALSESRAANETCKRQITELEQQIDNLRLSAAFMGQAGSDIGAKEKIDKLIREIDICIRLMED